MFGEAVNVVKSIQPFIIVFASSWPVLCLATWLSMVKVTLVTVQVPKCVEAAGEGGASNWERSC